MDTVIKTFSDAPALSEAVAKRWVELAREAVDERGAFHVALSGGSTPRRAFERLAEPDMAQEVEWKRIHIYWSDERCVPPDSPDSNYRMAHEAFLQRMPCPPDNVHRIHAEQPNPQQAARDYVETLKTYLPEARETGIGRFDLIMLGLGTDGHTASLFPDTQVLDVRDRAVAAVYVDKLESWRVTLTYPIINNARHLLVMAEGEAKAKIVRAVFEEPEGERYPIQRIKPLTGVLEWYLDAAAVSEVKAGQ